MKLSQFKALLDRVSQLTFVQPDGRFVPSHFHITEAGLTTKHFIDCGGTVRTEKTIGFQLWTANDFDHRLDPQKLKSIISVAKPLFGDEDLDIEIEYQTETIGRYGLEFKDNHFILTVKQTDCLAKDQCGIPPQKTKVKLSDLQSVESNNCTPGGGCC
ncbi:MAG: DUF6428 family protein [Cryomorphaceae bacterium]|nr:DUF6428 family protein [Cryomorphaceae bacterium]